jgi:hypothetical protein
MDLASLRWFLDGMTIGLIDKMGPGWCLFLPALLVFLLFIWFWQRGNAHATRIRVLEYQVSYLAHEAGIPFEINEIKRTGKPYKQPKGHVIKE